MSQTGDVILQQTNDGGEVTVTGGVMAMDGGLQTTAYLSLFGGNEDDPGGPASRYTWWANQAETETARQFRSETQNLLQALALTSANLRRIEDAARRDLAWMVTEGVALTVTVAASIPGLNKIRLAVSIEATGETENFVFEENWKASV